MQANQLSKAFKAANKICYTAQNEHNSSKRLKSSCIGLNWDRLGTHVLEFIGISSERENMFS